MSSKSFGIMPALVLGAALVLTAKVLSNGLLEFKGMDRTVSVKGLAEREVAADTAIWPVQFSDADNRLDALTARVQKNNEAVRAFLKLHGFSDDEIGTGTQSVIDKQAREYGGNDTGQFRYLVTSTVTVYSKDPQKVMNALGAIGELAKQNIAVLQDRYGNRVEYLFTGLNELKPQMVEEATQNARQVAQKFAQDSDSRLGKIKAARQGQFSIQDRDSNTPQIKRIRVVSTLEFYLAD